MKRVLIITYYWPPSGGSGVQRWLKASKYLSMYGWEPVIYTPLNPDVNSIDPSLEADIRADIKVIKHKITEPYKVYKILSGKKKGEKIEANIISSEGGGFLKKLSMHIRGNWFIPDPRVWWVGPSVRFLSGLIKEGELFDAVVSTGPPHSMHLIAQALHKKFNIPHLADFRDPWTKIFYFKHLGLSASSLKKHQTLERGVLSCADKVVVVSDKMKEEFSTREYSEFAGKVEVVTNGFDPDDFSTEKRPALKEIKERIDRECEGKFVIVHTGLLPKSADPDLLWPVLGRMVAENTEFASRLKIVTMGQTDSCVAEEIKAAGLESYYTQYGYVPHLESIGWQMRANVLLLPLRKEKESAAILTGKFYEYIACKGEIFAFGPVNGDLGRILKETGRGMMAEFDDGVAIEAIMRGFAKDYCSAVSKPAAEGSEMGSAEAGNNSAVEKYSRVKTTEQLAKLLDEISRK